jgi:hypothetical protein
VSAAVVLPVVVVIVDIHSQIHYSFLQPCIHSNTQLSKKKQIVYTKLNKPGLVSTS